MLLTISGITADVSFVAGLLRLTNLENGEFITLLV